MTTALAQAQPTASAIESVLIAGDLSKLSPEQRVQYYLRVCDSLGLNTLTQPFRYLTLDGKLVLYATKDCTEQLRKIHGVSVVDTTTQKIDDVWVVIAKVADKSGRTDMALGAVPIANLKGNALANALMKCETKAKRRATLSICGLGMLDETEVDTIPGAAPIETPVIDALPALPEPAPPVPRTFTGARIAKVEARNKGPVSWAEVTFITTDGEEITLPTAADSKDAAVSFFEQLGPEEPVTLTTDIGPRNGKERICTVERELKPEREPGEDDVSTSDVGF